MITFIYDGRLIGFEKIPDELGDGINIYDKKK
jgi:hypothetical protein